jgi:hypothetical protein
MGGWKASNRIVPLGSAWRRVQSRGVEKSHPRRAASTWTQMEQRGTIRRIQPSCLGGAARDGTRRRGDRHWRALSVPSSTLRNDPPPWPHVSLRESPGGVKPGPVSASVEVGRARPVLRLVLAGGGRRTGENGEALTPDAGDGRQMAAARGGEDQSGARADMG